ncbi:MAG: energy transducer TonB [Gemmatimonadetes bacterium]|nr:energy transducer TonB [Gemmatimonadota bacterium]
MFDLLQHPPRSSERLPLGAGVSVVVHAALALALIAGPGKTLLQPAPPTTESIIESALRYLLPPDRPGGAGAEAQASWSAMRGGLPVPAAPDVYTENREQVGASEPQLLDNAAPEPIEQAAAAQNAFTLQDVDTAAVRDPTSAVPAYPQLLEKQGIEGMAVVRFVVDSTGLADLATFRVVETNHSLFAAAVREALPRMKFHPATVGPRKVRQMVELPFRFNVRRGGADTPRRP